MTSPSEDAGVPDGARRLDDGLWAFDRSLRLGPLEVGGRMTAVRLGDGGLFLHSPVALDARTRRALDALGPVAHVVAPNLVHHRFVAPYREAYPGARLWAAPGLADKRRDLRFDETLTDTAPAAWAGELEQLCFRGVPRLNEVVFFHPRSRTLLLTDLAFNVIAPEGAVTKLWQRFSGTHGRFEMARYVRWMVRDRDAARASRDRVLAWDFDRVSVTHGAVVQTKGARLVRRAFAWLDGPERDGPRDGSERTRRSAGPG
jgi:hypothetical protein